MIAACAVFAPARYSWAAAAVNGGIVTGGQSGPIAAGFLGRKSVVQYKSGVYQSVKERVVSLLSRPYATPYTYSAWTHATADAGADEVHRERPVL